MDPNMSAERQSPVSSTKMEEVYDKEPVYNARKELLYGAEQAVNGERNLQYGDPAQDFRRTAALWSTYLGVTIEAHDVAALMCLLKLSRIKWHPGNFDSWMDLAGYAACGWDVAHN